MGTSKDLIVRIGGEGGEGIISAGDMIAQAAVRSGLEVLTFKTFPAEIRGGYAMYQIRFSKDRILSEGSGFNVLCVFNNEALQTNKSKLKAGNVLIYDFPGGDIESEVKIDGVHTYAVPMSKMAKEDLGNYRSKNMIALGVISHLFDISMESLKGTVKDKFGKKGQDVVDINYKALDMGAEFCDKSLKKSDPFKMGAGTPKPNKMIIAGNYAVGMGALLAGCKFFSAYPITPATEVAIMLAKYLPKTGGMLVQAEDEIASLANVCGASYAGVKTMTATSGPGLSLMQELVGYASMAELPIVICDVQRGGPSTGLPTKHEQSDLFMAAHGSHGDSSRIVISPENVKECIEFTIQAFNMAEKYQVPVLVLSDGSLGFRTESVDKPDTSKIKLIDRKRYTGGTDLIDENGKFMRYKFTSDGVSAMSHPGTPGGAYICTGLEHAENSAPRYTPDNHTKMIDKRMNKLDAIESEFPPPPIDDDGGKFNESNKADVGLISWGSTQGVVAEAVELARAEGLKVASFYPKIVWPLPLNAIDKFSKMVKTILIPEINNQGQLTELIRSKTNLAPTKYCVYGGLPLEPVQVLAKIKEVK